MIIAHRGASAYAPENTIAAFNKAIELGAKSFELDVQLTKDGHLIVCHDTTIDRTTDGTGLIAEMTLEEIQKYDAGSWYDPSFTGERIPLLSEVFAILPDDGLLTIEIKKAELDTSNIEAPLVALIEKHNRLEYTMVSSFNHYSLMKIKKINPSVKTVASILANLVNPVAYFKGDHFQVDAVTCHYETLSKMIVADLKFAGLDVYTWTVNDADIARRMLEMGVDAVLSNHPDILS